MLKDKVIIVTGGAGRIGSAFIKAIVAQNGTGVIAETNVAKADALKEEILKTNAKAKIEVLNIDICSKNSVEGAIEILRDKYGRIDALVNNAYPISKNFGKNFFEIDMQDFNDFVSLHLGGYFNISQIFVKYFLEQGYGNIINICSIYGVVAPKFEIYNNTTMTMPVEYAAIKSGLIHLTKYMAKYFKGMNIKVNALSPGGIFDNQPEPFLEKYKDQCLNKGMLNNSDLKGTLVYLLSDMSRYVNGQNIVVDDGFSL